MTGTAIVAGTALRLAWAAWVDAGNDESYYGLFARHLDWSYFDHPPLLALIEAAGLALTGGRGSVAALAPRLGFVLAFAGSTWLMARLATRCYGPRAGAVAAWALNAAGYFGLIVGGSALPDGPLVFFWLLALERLAAAREDPDRLGPWIGVGLAWAGAFLSKYHAAFLPLGLVVDLMIDPAARRRLRWRGPMVAGLIGLVGLAPVVGWNARHAWASFAFQGGRALGTPAWRPAALASALVAPWFYLFPWIGIPLIVAAARAVRRARRDPTGRAERFLLAQAIGPWLTFALVACARPVLPHWPLVGTLALFPILGRDWAMLPPRRLGRRLATVAALLIAAAVLAIGQARAGWLAPWPDRLDPTAEALGWDRLAAELDRLGLLDRPGTFLFTGHWYTSGQLARAVGDRAPVLCYHAGDARGFASWSRPEDWVGADGILVADGRRSTEPACFARYFTRIEPLGTLPITRGGRTVRRLRLFRCVRQTQPFPFARGSSRRETGDGRREAGDTISRSRRPGASILPWPEP